MTTHFFTFGQNHMSSYPLPTGGGRLADYWVAVESSENNHREIFIDKFTSRYCPSPAQFSSEYTHETFKGSYFPGGELLRIGA